MLSSTSIDSLLQDLDLILTNAHACLADPSALAVQMANLEDYLSKNFESIQASIAENGFGDAQRLRLASCVDRLVDLQTKTQARIAWFDALGAELADMVERS